MLFNAYEEWTNDKINDVRPHKVNLNHYSFFLHKIVDFHQVPASADNKEKMRAFIMSKAIGSKGASHKKLREQNFDPVEDKIEQSKTLMARMSGWMRNAFG